MEKSIEEIMQTALEDKAKREKESMEACKNYLGAMREAANNASQNIGDKLNKALLAEEEEAHKQMDEEIAVAVREAEKAVRDKYKARYPHKSWTDAKAYHESELLRGMLHDMKGDKT